MNSFGAKNLGKNPEENSNRKARRAAGAAKGSKRLAAVSIVASSSLISGYLAVLRPEVALGSSNECVLNLDMADYSVPMRNSSQRLITSGTVERVISDAFSFGNSEGATGEFVVGGTNGTELCEEITLNFNHNGGGFPTFFLNENLALDFQGVSEVFVNFGYLDFQGQEVYSDIHDSNGECVDGQYFGGYNVYDENYNVIYYKDSYYVCYEYAYDAGDSFLNYAPYSSPKYGIGMNSAENLEINHLRMFRTKGLVLEDIQNASIVNGFFSNSGGTDEGDSAVQFLPGGSTSPGNPNGDPYRANSSLDISRSSFFNNRGELGGAVFAYAENFSVSESQFNRNAASGSNASEVIVAAGAVLIVGESAVIRDSFFLGNTSAKSGGAVSMVNLDPNFDFDSGGLPPATLTVERSSFIENRSGRTLTVTRPHLHSGGAISAQGELRISDSTFDSNTSENGGAVSAIDVDIENTTFVNNQAYGPGGAVAVGSSADIRFSTFIENKSGLNLIDRAGDSVYGLGASIYPGQEEEIVFDVQGNIFADSAPDPNSSHLGFDSVPQKLNLRSNVLTANDYCDSTPPAALLQEGNRIVEFSSLSFVPNEVSFWSLARNGATAVTDFEPPQTAEIRSGSSAQNVVPVGTVVARAFDQRGLPRRSENGFLDAGSFEIQESALRLGSPDRGSVSSIGTIEPTVLSVSPRRISVRNEVVTISGSSLSGVSAIMVGGKPAEIISSTNNQIALRVPNGMTGEQAVQLRFAGKSMNLTQSLQFDPMRARAKSLIRAFSPNSTRVTRAMKREIRTFVAEHPELNRVICKGFVSTSPTSRGKTLASKRSDAVCSYIRKKYPDMAVEARQSVRTGKSGAELRRVRLILE